MLLLASLVHSHMRMLCFGDNTCHIAFLSVTKYIFCVCAKKSCTSLELNPGPSAYRLDALPTELSG